MVLLPSLGGQGWGSPAPAVLVLQAGLPAVLGLFCHTLPVPDPLCPHPQEPPGALSTSGSLQAPSPPISPPPTCLWRRCWRQEQGNIVQGCPAQVLGSPPSPHPPPCWGPALGVSRLFTDIAISCITFPSFLLPFQSSKAFEVQL